MRKISLLGVLLLVSLTVLAETTRPPVFLSVEQEGQFRFIFDQATSTATGAVVGGLIGAGIESAVRSGKDEDKLEELQPFLSDTSCKTQFLTAFEEKLASADYHVERNVEPTPEGISINLDIKDCGFKVVNSQTMAMAAFVNFETLTDDPEVESLDGETFHFYGKEHYQFSELLGMEEGINNVFSKVLHRSGVRLANKILYR